MIEIPKIAADPRNRAELEDWLKRRAEYFKGKPPPLSPREYLMVQRLQSTRHPYSLT